MLLDDFDRWATTQPEATAVRSGELVIGYRDLRLRALEAASVLRSHGVGLGDRVAIHMPKSIGAVVNMLGTLYAGAAFIPIDTRMPTARVARILSACAARAAIGPAALLEQTKAMVPSAGDGLAVLVGDSRRGLEPTCPAEADTPPCVAANLPAYLLYTSGSTGQPKGVVVSHAAATAFVQWACRTFALTPRDRLANFAPLSFDLSVFDVFGALSSGAAVDLIPPELLLRPAELVQRLARWHTTTIYAVPSTITLLEREGKVAETPLPHLRRVLYAGEPFDVALLVAAMRALPHCDFYNLFGPTETNVCTYHHIAERPALSDPQVPIGVSCEHLTVELLDDSGCPVVSGEEGELCVAGPSVMTEYFRDPVATLAAFHAGSLFGDGRRRYRTGDRAVLDSAGRFWFHGRRDRLIKRRGYRIELGEIDAALQRHPQVRQAAAIAEYEGSETRIVAYVALENRGTLTSLILRAHCGSLLPPYMVPDSVEIVDELPRTLTGKLDLQLLRHRGLAS